MVFVDGDFWHGCPRHPKLEGFEGPNAQLWQAKLVRNKERDDKATRVAEDAGWIVVRVWECEVREDPGAAVARVLNAAEGTST